MDDLWKCPKCRTDSSAILKECPVCGNSGLPDQNQAMKQASEYYNAASEAINGLVRLWRNNPQIEPATQEILRNIELWAARAHLFKTTSD